MRSRVGGWAHRAYNVAMEISLRPEIEARLNRIASQDGKAADQLVQELVANYLDHDEWFRAKVGKGLASLDAGKFGLEPGSATSDRSHSQFPLSGPRFLVRSSYHAD